MPRTKRTEVNCPTPWVTVEEPLAQVVYRFRIKRHRRHGALHIEFHKDSPTAAGKEFVVANDKIGFFDFVAAGHALLSTAHWDPTTDRRYATCKPKWNAHSMHYDSRSANVTTLALHLDALVNPRRGRVKAVDVIGAARAAQGDRPARRSGYTASRANRTREFLLALTNALNAVMPVHQRLNDGGRRELTGYTQVETQRMQSLCNQTLAAIREFRDIVRDNRFTQPRADDPDQRPLPVTDTVQTMHTQMFVDDSELPPADAPLPVTRTAPFDLDLSGLP